MEVLIFIVMAFGFYAVCMARRAWLAQRERRRDRTLARLIPAFVGSRIDAATRALGPPAGVIDGTTGRALYIWRPPREEAIPRGGGLVVVSLTVERNGSVSGASWRIIREPATL